MGLPPLFFSSGGKLKNQRAKKREEKGTDGGLTAPPFPSCPNFIAPSPPSPYPTIPIPVRSDHQLWRCHGIKHIVLHAVTSP